MTDDDDGWRSFLALCSKHKTKEAFDDLFDLFLTIEERNAIATRYFIIRDLLKGEETQREIAQKRQVSLVKITRGSNYLKTISQQTRDFLIKHIK